MKERYIERIYAGWLAKIIGIRLGAAVEGWTYDQIKNVYGELHHYPVDYKRFAADDDSNGPLFFLKALEDCKDGFELTAQDVGEALLNYAPYEHGFFWWGGYGVSTEHTAYLNLRNGIEAPRSGSIEQNGHAVAEQIGGQIFIDTWGLVTPGNPDLAAKYARCAASVTHDGNGIYGGIFVATCISYAFVEEDIHKIIEKGLSYIPKDCEYTNIVRKVMEYHQEHPQCWRDCFQYIKANFGYDKYPGNCHIIPNSAVMILALLYGEGDFSNTLNICNMCGWDTDCNVGNIATIMGVRGGLESIDYHKWRKPINDLLVCSSVIGSLNIMDIPYGASYIVKLAYEVAGEEMPEPWRTIIYNRIDSCHFEYPGSTHNIQAKAGTIRRKSNQQLEYEITNSDAVARSGQRSLKVFAKPLLPAERVYVYKETHLGPTDFNNNRYSPSFSPLVYPGDAIHGSVYIPDYGRECNARMYAKEARSGDIIEGESTYLEKGKWYDLVLNIPKQEGTLIDEIGFALDIDGIHHEILSLTAFVDDLYVEHTPDYTVDFTKEEEVIWTPLQRELSQFTRAKGLMYLKDGEMNLTCADWAEAYTGRHDWEDYTAEFELTPMVGEDHFVNFRVQGAIRSYAVGLVAGDKIVLQKNDNGYTTLAQNDFAWSHHKACKISVTVKKNKIFVYADGHAVMEYMDDDYPYLMGSVGVSVKNGSHCKYRYITVKSSY